MANLGDRVAIISRLGEHYSATMDDTTMIRHNKKHYKYSHANKSKRSHDTVQVL